MMVKGVDQDMFKSDVKRNLKLNYSYLFYTDGVIFLDSTLNKNTINIIVILRCFHIALGLKINLEKCDSLGVGITLEKV